MHLHKRVPAMLALATAAALALTACAGEPGRPNAGSPSPGMTTTAGDSGHASGAGEDQAGDTSSPSDSPAADVTKRMRVRDGEVTPPLQRVEVQRGQVVRLVVTSDRRDRVHVHGYDIEKRVTPSQPAVITFTADEVGVFEVETHESGLQLLQLQVR